MKRIHASSGGTEPPIPHRPPKSPTQWELSVLAPGSCVWVAYNGSISIRLNKIEKHCLKFPKMSWKCLYNPLLKTSVLKPIVNVNYRNPPAHHLSGHTKLWILTQSPGIYFWLTYFVQSLGEPLMMLKDPSCRISLIRSERKKHGFKVKTLSSTSDLGKSQGSESKDGWHRPVC